MLLITGPAAADFLPDTILTETRPGQVTGVLTLGPIARAASRSPRRHRGGPRPRTSRSSTHYRRHAARRARYASSRRVRASPTSTSRWTRRKTSPSSCQRLHRDRGPFLRRSRARRAGAEPGRLAGPAVSAIAYIAGSPATDARLRPGPPHRCRAGPAGRPGLELAPRPGKSACAPGSLPRRAA